MLGGLVVERVDTDRVRLRSLSPDARDDRALAFERLMAEHLERSYRLAAVILGDAGEAEDAVHDAAVAARHAWSSLRDEAAAAGWFARIVVNTCRDRLRRRARRRLLEVLRPPTPAEHPIAGDPAAGVAARDELRRAFERLSPDERVVLVLRYEQDLTVPATAALLGIPDGTVKSRIHAALGKLRAALEGDRR